MLHYGAFFINNNSFIRIEKRSRLCVCVVLRVSIFIISIISFLDDRIK